MDTWKRSLIEQALLNPVTPEQERVAIEKMRARNAAEFERIRQDLRAKYESGEFDAASVGWVLKMSHEDALAYIGVERRADDTDMTSYWPE